MGQKIVRIHFDFGVVFFSSQRKMFAGSLKVIGVEK